MHTKYCCNILHLISLSNLDQESDVDDSVLEIPAFGSSPENDVSIVQSSVTSSDKDVLHVESFCLSSIGVQRNQASNEYDNYVAIKTMNSVEMMKILNLFRQLKKALPRLLNRRMFP